MAATAKAIFDGDSAKLDAVIKGIDRKLLALQASFAAVAGFTAAAFALPAAAAVGLAAGVGRVLEVAGALNDLHNQTGIAVDELVVLQEEFKQAGQSGEDVGPAINKMQRALADGSASGAVAELGLDMEALRKQTPIAQFHALGAAIDKIEDPAERTAKAMAIFGKSGGSLLSVFASKGFGSAAVAVGEQAAILARDAALFDDAGDKLGTAGLKVQGFFVGVADRVVPVLVPLLDRLAALDLAQKGRDTGDVIATFAQALADDQLGAILAATLKYSLAEAANFFVKGLHIGIVGTISFLLAGLTELMAKITDKMYEGVLAVVGLVDGLPGVKGYAAATRKKMGETRDANDRDRDRLMEFAAGKYVPQVFDTKALKANLNDKLFGSALAAEAARNAALAASKTTRVPGIGEDLFGGTGSSGVSALQRIGGAFGMGGGGDPLLDATREGNSILKEIRDRLMPAGDSSPSRGALLARYA